MSLMLLSHDQRQGLLMIQVSKAETEGWSVSSAGYLDVSMRRRKRNTLRRLLGLDYAAEQKYLTVSEDGRIIQQQHPALITTRPLYRHDR